MVGYRLPEEKKKSQSSNEIMVGVLQCLGISNKKQTFVGSWTLGWGSTSVDRILVIRIQDFDLICIRLLLYICLRWNRCTVMPMLRSELVLLRRRKNHERDWSKRGQLFCVVLVANF